MSLGVVHVVNVRLVATCSCNYTHTCEYLSSFGGYQSHTDNLQWQVLQQAMKESVCRIVAIFPACWQSDTFCLIHIYVALIMKATCTCIWL